MSDAIRWPVWKRAAFRFLFVYFLLWAIPFPLDYDPMAGAWIGQRWSTMWETLVPRLAKAFLGKSVAVVTAGSSDTTFHYLQIVCFLLLSALATLMWSALDRKRPDYERLHRYLHTYLRFLLAAAMLWYGIQKIIPAQFPPLSLDRLVQTYGSSAPMGFLWTFMGASPAYEMFAGASELLAGVLLLFRRTALAGALVTIAVMSNVVALNLFFDASIKTYASHLLLIAVFLAAPDAGRVIDFFFRRPTQPLFERRWARVGSVVVGALLVALFVYTDLRETITYFRQTISLDHRSPLRGVWNVDVLDVDGVARPPLVTDTSRWRRVVFDYQGQSSIFLMNDDRNLYKTKIDATGKTIEFRNRYDPRDTFRLAYARPDQTTLQLDGRVASHALHAVCKLDEKQYLLTTRGFHWVNERALMR